MLPEQLARLPSPSSVQNKRSIRNNWFQKRQGPQLFFTCVLFELLKNFVFSFRLGDVSKEQTCVCDRDVHFQSFSGQNFVSIILKS